MKAELTALTSLPGVTGYCLHRGARVLEHQLPSGYPVSAVSSLCATVADTFLIHANARRPLTHSYFQYPEGGLLIITASSASGTALSQQPWNPEQLDPTADLFLSLLINNQSALAALIPPARALLQSAALDS